MWRLSYHAPLWLTFLAFRVIMVIIGWVVIPIAALCRAYSSSKSGGQTVWHFTWKWMFLWDNYEDGIANDTYVKFNSMFMRIVYWSCFRNPVNNLRIVPYLSCKIDPERVDFRGSFGGRESSEVAIRTYDTKVPQWFYCWQGLYSNFYWQFNAFGKLWRLWIGWKIYPTDIYGVTEYRKLGAGFATQFKRVK